MLEWDQSSGQEGTIPGLSSPFPHDGANFFAEGRFCQQVISYFPHYRDPSATWPPSFKNYVKTRQIFPPSPKLVKLYCISLTVEEYLLLNFEITICHNYKSTEAFCRKYFLSLWKYPKEDSGEFLTGVLRAMKHRMRSDAKGRAVKAVSTSFSRSKKDESEEEFEERKMVELDVKYNKWTSFWDKRTRRLVSKAVG